MPIPKEYFSFNSLTNNLIAQHNDLIKSVADMKKNSIKIFEIAVGAINTENETQREVVIKKEIIFDILNQKGNSKNSRLRTALKELQHNAVFHLQSNKENQATEILINPISKIEWNKEEDFIKLTFSPEILPYITMLKENFTQYRLENIAKFSSKHSITLYKLLSMYYNQFNYYHNTNKRTSAQLDNFQNPIISLNELHRITNTTNQYKTFNLFKVNVIDKATQEINRKTEFNIHYDKIRSGRSITAIKFYIRKKASDAHAQDVQHLQTVQSTAHERELEKAHLYSQALKNQFTIMLVERFLINVQDTLNQTTMINLAQYVYPQYQKIVTQWGLNSLTTHLDYVHNHINDWNRHTNIAKYLATAVNDYLNKKG